MKKIKLTSIAIGIILLTACSNDESKLNSKDVVGYWTLQSISVPGNTQQVGDAASYYIDYSLRIDTDGSVVSSTHTMNQNGELVEVREEGRWRLVDNMLHISNGTNTTVDIVKYIKGDLMQTERSPEQQCYGCYVATYTYKRDPLYTE